MKKLFEIENLKSRKFLDVRLFINDEEIIDREIKKSGKKRAGIFIEDREITNEKMKVTLDNTMLNISTKKRVAFIMILIACACALEDFEFIPVPYERGCEFEYDEQILIKYDKKRGFSTDMPIRGFRSWYRITKKEYVNWKKIGFIYVNCIVLGIMFVFFILQEKHLVEIFIGMFLIGNIAFSFYVYLVRRRMEQMSIEIEVE